jgi:hypothetical protein
MKKSYQFLISVLFLGAYLLSACSGPAKPQKDVPPQSPSVVALKIESSSPDDVGVNDNAVNDNGGNTSVDTANTNDNTNTTDNYGNTNHNGNSNDIGNTSSGPGQEVIGVVDAITANSITISGVTYSLASFTKFNNIISVGDQVKVHIIVNADGTFTIREIDRAAGIEIGNDISSNTNTGRSEDNTSINSNDNSSNFNNNSNEDSSNANYNSNDDSSNADYNSNDNGSNTNYNSNDSGSNSNDNGNENSDDNSNENHGNDGDSNHNSNGNSNDSNSNDG